MKIIKNRNKLLKILRKKPRVEEWDIFFAGKHRPKVGIISNDFTHDAVLWLNGDFGSLDQEIEYMDKIRRTLNRSSTYNLYDIRYANRWIDGDDEFVELDAEGNPVVNND